MWVQSLQPRSLPWLLKRRCFCRLPLDWGKSLDLFGRVDAFSSTCALQNRAQPCRFRELPALRNASPQQAHKKPLRVSHTLFVSLGELKNPVCSLSCCDSISEGPFCHQQLLDPWEHVDANTPDTSSIPLRPKSLLPSAPGACWG